MTLAAQFLANANTFTHSVMVPHKEKPKVGRLLVSVLCVVLVVINI